MAAETTITLTTDFGVRDPYVAEMKGVILSIDIHAILVDVTHEIPKFDVRAAAFTLASAAPYFPAGAIHLAVVDPEVGTQRRAIVVQTQKATFVGPDNGVLMLASQNQGIKMMRQLTNPKFMLPKISGTFHGRDIFAPAAAYLDVGFKPADFGPEIKDAVTPEFAQVRQHDGSLFGEVLHVDGFGNVVTNILAKDSAFEEGKPVQVEFAGTVLKIAFVKTYAAAKPKEPVLLVGSHGFIEVALNQGGAAEKFGLRAGDKIKVGRD